MRHPGLGRGVLEEEGQGAVFGSDLLGQAAGWSSGVMQGLLSVGPQLVYKIDMCFNLYF